MVVLEGYSLKTIVDADFDTAMPQVVAALKEQGFGVLTEIDVKSTLKTKLDVDFHRYQILGACNPPLAHKALTAEAAIGLLLPCNVIVYEDTDAGNTVVMAIDPMTMVQMSNNPALQEVAEQARQKLETALAAL
ncbi:MAG: DUF302 domain-containing protein [Anaerolineae bacterium]|nr:DUF302 domain-containing protein [Anaerolineae bacterium]MCA9895392.1 DUF302 domain-containing protein [Anaerolineae bacterium]MCB9459201.1 DUF302 domain-containing protein [Anaerolineaceae bacterium]